MSRKASVILIVLFSVAAGVAAWAVLRFTAPNLLRSISSTAISPVANRSTPEMWDEAVAKVKEARIESEGVGLEIPPELQHYPERRWFLATQVAEVRKHNLATYQDFLDLATKLKNGELVEVPAVTDTYVLFGVGQVANDRPFSHYVDDRSIELYNEHQLREEFARLDAERTGLTTEISNLNKQITGLNRRDRTRRAELQKQLSAQQQELNSKDEHKRLLNELYGQPTTRDRLFRDYESLQTLAKEFRGRSFDLENPADRQTLKVTLLSSLRPQALKVLEQVAASYHVQFNRPLPVSSLVRPEQYQDALRKRNRSATMIETPPHSTGLAFDIDYRYMSGSEQNFVMAELARLKQAGRIEVLRERTANYHVFVFIDGVRPSDDLVTASLEDIGPAPAEAAPEAKTSARAKSVRTQRSSQKGKRAKRSPPRRRGRR